jgi:predicted PurR-regulated permease PerM
MDPSGPLVSRKTLRRLLLLLLFIALVFVFRKLMPLLAFFVAFERILGISSGWLVRRAHLRHRTAVLLLSVVLFGAINGALLIGAGRAVHTLVTMRHTLPERVAMLRQEALYQRIQEHLPSAERLVEAAEHHAQEAVELLWLASHLVLYSLAGFILAVVFLVEREELGQFWRSIDPRSIQGTLLRWFGHVAEALLVTLQFQLVVAAVNAVLTFPILLVVGIPHAAALTFIIFLSGLVPVAGNLIAGGVLALLAYRAQGWIGVGVFMALTFLLHKIESYYLNPRLAMRHVRLPAFLLVVSLLLWEHLLGFIGLFISFPFLYVAIKIRNELRIDEDGAAQPADSTALMG